MATCFKLVKDGSNYVLSPDTTSGDIAGCVYVVQSGEELMQEPPWYLSVEEALAITTAVILVWAMAWGFKQVARTLRESNDENND